MAASTTRVAAPAAAVTDGTRRRRRPRRKATGALTGWAFAAPALAVYLAFLVYPAARSVELSFTNWDGISSTKKWVGLGNYRKMLHDAVVHTAVRNNIQWALVTILVPMALGLALAVAVNSQIYLRPLIRTVLYTPAVLPLVGVGTIWGWLYNPDGAINILLRDVGLGSLTHAWLGDNTTAIWAIMVPACWVRTGFPLLLYLAALQGIPVELYESARSEGASGWQQFWNITFPSLRQTHYIVIALSMIEAVKVFDLVYAMTNGGPGNATQVMGTWMYFNVFQSYNAGYGTAIAVVITVVAVAVGIPYVRSQAREL
jgi:raffinose/stachyose/melibiose transport system permease protein